MRMDEQPTDPASGKLLLALLALALIAAGAGAAFFVLGGRDEVGDQASTPGSTGDRPEAADAETARTARTGPRPRPIKPRFFSPTSFWNAPLPDDAAVDPASRPLVEAFAAEIERERREGIGPWIQTDEYTTPIWTAGKRQRKVRVKLDTGPWGRTLQAVLDEGVPIPPRARPSPGTDGHMTIYQPSTDRLWEFWRAVKRPDGWHASWGGAMKRVSRSPGYYTDKSWPGRSWFNWGSTATSLPVAGGTILIDEIRAGQIPHALAIAIPQSRAGVFAWPAQRTDGKGGPRTVPEGARLRIDPSLDVERLAMHPVGKMIARAAQRHGLVVRDVTGHATAFYAEDPLPTGENPYGRLFDGELPSSVLAGFPWERLQVLKMNVCRKEPCPRGDSP